MPGSRSVFRQHVSPSARRSAIRDTPARAMCLPRQGLLAIITSIEEDAMTDIKKQEKRTVAITGAGGGLVRATALAFAAKGYRVFGTALNTEEIANLKEASSGAVTLFICDITDEADVAAWARQVTGETNGGLDLLVQNAGTLTPGPL